jgi:hypothetical protein
VNDLRTVDIVFATTMQSNGQMSQPGPVRSRIQLHQDLYIGLCSQELWNEVFKACRPAGHSFALVPQAAGHADLPFPSDRQDW